jgi:mRNA interferase MazF
MLPGIGRNTVQELIRYNNYDISRDMYSKDFERWNKLKQNLNALKNQDIRVKEGEIWWCALGVNIGNEIDGKNELSERPVLVIKKFPNKSYWIVPLSKTDREHKFAIPFIIDSKISKAIISQTRVISSQRFIRRMHKVSSKKLLAITNQVKSML